MDGHGFDLLTRRLARLLTRRQGLRVLLAGAGAAGVVSAAPDDANAACGGDGARCQSGKRCCSGLCLRGRKKKGKKKRKPGRCACSFPQQACNDAGDCCFAGSSCGDNGCDTDDRCCFGEGAECYDPCECCSGSTCFFADEDDEFGACVSCVALQEPCIAGVDFCCNDGTFCDENGGGGGDVCCLDAGFTCEEDLDCCGALGCSSRVDNTCQNCLGLGDFCIPQDNRCCDKDAKCFDNGCDQAGNRCCLEEGGRCESACDCCEDHVCSGGICRRSLDRQAPSNDDSGAGVEASTPRQPAAENRGSKRRVRQPAVRRRRRR